MALGGQSFDELLVQLGQAHQQELQELRVTLQTQALVASNALSDSYVAQVGAHGVASTTSSAFSAKPVSRFEHAFDQVRHQEEEKPYQPANKRASFCNLSRAPKATTGGMAAARATMKAQPAKSQRSFAKFFESYEPKFIDFSEQCSKYYPNKQWDDLQLREKVWVLREALKPKHFMINPYCYFVRVWSLVHAFTLAFVGLVTPYEVVFVESGPTGLFLANRLIDLLFLADMILQFFLQVEIHRPHRGGSFIQRDPWTCRLMYLRSWFFIDLVSIFPYDVLAMNIVSSTSIFRNAKIMRCLKLLRLAKLVRMLRPSRAQLQWRDALGLRLATQKLIKFGIFLLLISHWMACAWAFCGITFGAELCDHAGVPVGSGGGVLGARDATWATTLYTGGKFSPDSACDHSAVYAASLHWAVMTLTSIGYGDIVPIRFEEYIVCIVCMIVGGLLWAYVIGSICSIISDASPVERNFEMKTEMLNVAMDEAQLPLDERDKYRAFLHEAKAYDRRISFAHMTESFSPTLRAQLMFHISQESITQVYYFNDPSAPPSILLDVASCLTPKLFGQLESLDHLRHCLCMIDRGTVAHCGRILLHPNVFHEDFIVSLARFQKVTRTVSLTYTQLLVLTRPDMEGMLMAHPAFRRKIRRCAVKTAFIQAVRITLAAYQKWRATMPEGSHLTLPEAFDKAFGDKALAMPGTFRQGGSEQDIQRATIQRAATQQPRLASIHMGATGFEI